MLEGGNFLFHVAHPDVAGGAARLVKQVNDPARQAAKQDDDETGHADEARGREPIIGRRASRNRAEVGQHDLKDVLARPDAGETDRQR